MTKVTQINVPEGRSENCIDNLHGRNGFENVNQTRPIRDRVCYGCGKKDHLIRECPYKASNKPTVKAAAVEITCNGSTPSEKAGLELLEKPKELSDTEKNGGNLYCFIHGH